MNTHTRTHTHTHARTHARTHAHMHTHARTHAHTHKLGSSHLMWFGGAGVGEWYVPSSRVGCALARGLVAPRRLWRRGGGEGGDATHRLLLNSSIHLFLGEGEEEVTLAVNYWWRSSTQQLPRPRYAEMRKRPARTLSPTSARRASPTFPVFQTLVGCTPAWPGDYPR